MKTDIITYYLSPTSAAFTLCDENIDMQLFTNLCLVLIQS